MSQIKDEVIFISSGLNSDDDKRFFPKGDSDYRLNVVPTDNGSTFTVTNIKGTKKYSHTFSHNESYSGATYTSIGDCYDVTRNAVYYFIHSSESNHCILRFNYDDQSFDKIVWDNTNIGLDEDYPIVDAFMIDDWLHWNPRSSSPRVINVQWAYYDHIAYEWSPEYGPSDTWSEGVYVKKFNKVYITETTGLDKNLNDPRTSEGFTFVSWTYNDVITGSVEGSLGTDLYKERSFYNITRILQERPTARVRTDSSKDFNFIVGNVFQFCYRFYTPYQGYSITSPFSNVVTPDGTEYSDGNNYSDVFVSNRIIVELSTSIGLYDGSIIRDFLFESLEILFRTSETDNWKIAKRFSYDEAVDNSIDTGTYGQLKYSFYNDGYYEVVDNTSISVPYTSLPRLTNAQWSLDGQRVVYGYEKSGFNNKTLDISSSVGYKRVNMRQSTGTEQDALSFSLYGVLQFGSIFQYKYRSSECDSLEVVDGDILSITINNVEYIQSLNATDVSSDDNYAQAVANFIKNLESFPGLVKAYRISNRVHYETIWIYEADISVYSGFEGTLVLRKFPTFKTGAIHSFCFYYYDFLGRRSAPMTHEDLDIHIGTLPELYNTLSGTNFSYNITFTISHEAPSWATHWSFGYAGNKNISHFVQYNSEAIFNVRNGDPVTDDHLAIQIKGLQTLKIEDSGNDNYFSNSNLTPYEYSEGDRVRIITKYKDLSSGDYGDYDIADEIYDYEISLFDETYHVLYVNTGSTTAEAIEGECGVVDGDNIGEGGDVLTIGQAYKVNTDPITHNEIDYAVGDIFIAKDTGFTSTSGQVKEYISISCIIEIYTPFSKEDNLVYKEIGERYRVEESSGSYYHSCNETDQDASNDGEHTIYGGDTYLIPRAFANSPYSSNTAITFVESYSWSDFFDSEFINAGKVGVDTGIGEVESNVLRWGNRYLPSSSSGLSEFDPADFISLSSQYGEIQAIRQMGGTLRVYFERSNASLYVNKTSLQQQDGVSQVVLSDQVLNQPNYSPYLYGTVFPESVRMVDRHVYFYDVYRGCFVRDSANGMIPISGKKGSNEFDYKMSSWWKEKSLALRESGVSNVNVRTAWDEEHGLVVISIEDSSDADNNAVIVFHEGSNRWYSYLDISQESYTDQDENVTEAYNIDSLSSSVSSHYAEYSGTLNASTGAVYIPDISLSAGDKIVVIFEDDSADTTQVNIQIDDYDYLLDYNGEFLFDYNGNILIA